MRIISHTLAFAGETLQFSVFAARLARLTQATGTPDMLDATLAGVLATWDMLDDDGMPMPITAEHIKELRTIAPEFITALVDTINAITTQLPARLVKVEQIIPLDGLAMLNPPADVQIALIGDTSGAWKADIRATSESSRAWVDTHWPLLTRLITRQMEHIAGRNLRLLAASPFSGA
jgi:hypothetical protein